MDDLGLPLYTQNSTEAKKKWLHLQRAKLEDFHRVKIRIIIGEDHPYLTAHREILEAGINKPMAKRTKLGGVLAGKWGTLVGNSSSINFTSAMEGERLDSLMRSFFSVDTFGVSPQETKGSIEDRKDLEILKDTMKKKEDKWECGLLWKDNCGKFGNTKRDALSRLFSNERRMKRDPAFGEMYRSKLREYEGKQYIRQLTPAEERHTTEKTSYIPHFGVFNINKPGKLSIVFESASKTDGVRLNDHLLTGPDLIRPLTSVLLNFRTHNIAINGDIEDMFHRVGIRTDDQDSQRFLWRYDDGPVKTYAMTVLIFGACSSPSSAIYVKNRNAETFAVEYPEASRVIEEDFYCDDCLSGAKKIPEAIHLRKEITKINQKGNFFVKKWLSNSKEVLESIPQEERSAGIKQFGEKTELPTERVLGLWWNPKEDMFTFTADFKKVDPTLLEGRRPTKREASSLLMSIFDPLGFLGNYKIRGVILLQRTWRSGIDWDEELSDAVFKEWTSWVNMLKETVKVKVPRCYYRELHLASDVQLHTLVDASEEACAAVCFLRVQRGDAVLLSFVAAKTKVAPTKKLTIPRLKLLAAVIGACLADTVVKELRVKINSRTFWCDSKTVLLWIRSETLRYKEYVANRVSRIHLLSNVSEWRWIPTKDNIADQGTRLEGEIEFSPETSWIKGPQFLLQNAETWPLERRNEKVEEEQDEIKKTAIFAVSIASSQRSNAEWNLGATVNMERFSSFLRLRRVQAAVVKAARFWVDKLRKKASQSPWSRIGKKPLPGIHGKQPGDIYARMKEYIRKNVRSNIEPEDIWKAESILMKRVQPEVFPEDMESLSKGTLSKNSKLWKLSPVLRDGIIHLKGRIDKENVPEEMKTPIILPAKHYFTELLIISEHVKNAHQGHETVLSNLRQKYWIIEGRAAIRRVVAKCRFCKIRTAKPMIPEMGNLPYYRISTGKPPFYYTGLDLFGPVEVVVKRHHEKRCVCLFTCMVTRAIHLEVAYGLSTDETMMALSRFVDQRERPGHSQ